ncbi:hypothetical protein D1007_46256 [Hordeum vulgare]|nr:hypothetical protein D1007_46256 [Hordeum vulgare]
MRADRRIEIERTKIGLEKQEAAIKKQLKKAKTFGETELEMERSQLAWNAEDAKIMLANETVLDEHVTKWLTKKKKEINDRRKLDYCGPGSRKISPSPSSVQQTVSPTRNGLPPVGRRG